MPRTNYATFRPVVRPQFLRPWQAGATQTFLERALEEGRRYEQQVAQDLSRVVFERAFPGLAQALAGAGDHNLADVHQAALVLLYRLLFLLYAEDRGLLPVNDTGYDDYGLRTPVRDHVARRMDQSDTFSTVAEQLLRPRHDPLHDHRPGRRLHRPAALQRRTVRRRGRSPARRCPPARLGVRPDSPRSQPHRDRRRAPLRQLSRHVRPAARLHIRAPARTRAGLRRRRQDRHPPQPLRAQGQRQLLHAAGASRPDRGPHAQAAYRRASQGVRATSPTS